MLSLFCRRCVYSNESRSNSGIRLLQASSDAKKEIDCNINDQIDSTPTVIEDDDGVISGSAIQHMSCADSVALKEEIAKLREDISI